MDRPKHLQTRMPPTCSARPEVLIDSFPPSSLAHPTPLSLEPTRTMPTSEEVHQLFAELTSDEEIWSSREELLNSHGYKLRPRLQRGWTPSWTTTGISPLDSEDGESLVVRVGFSYNVMTLTSSQTSLVDAFTEDGKRVIIKEVGRNDEESRITKMLGSGPLQDDPRNHCVPLLEIIDDPDDSSKSYMVMPLLRAADHPPFDQVKEVIDFVDQMLEVCLILS
jgi:hypothetical protein